MIDVMEDLAKFTSLAQRGDPVSAAREFMAPLSDDAAPLLESLLKVALWQDSMIEDFERCGMPVLLRGPFGQFWFTPFLPRRALMPPAPVITPRGLKALSMGIVDVLTAQAA